MAGQTECDDERVCVCPVRNTGYRLAGGRVGAGSGYPVGMPRMSCAGLGMPPAGAPDALNGDTREHGVFSRYRDDL